MKHRLLSLILVLALVLGCLPFGAMAAQTEEPLFSADEFANPSMQYRPGVRWWLPGGAIEANEMVREVELLAANGFGYAEINPFGKSASFPAGYEDTSYIILYTIFTAAENFLYRFVAGQSVTLTRQLFEQLHERLGLLCHPAIGKASVVKRTSAAAFLDTEPALAQRIPHLL